MASEVSFDRLAGIGLSMPDLLLPGPEVDLPRWAVNACDQHVHDRSYWDRARCRIGNRPSALSLVLPEADLGREDLSDRIQAIHRAMDGYLHAGVLRPTGPGFVVVHREIPGRIRRSGLLVAFDLEAWHDSRRRRFALRPTESLVEERLPARGSIREGASLEIPHALALVDDPRGRLSETLDATTGRELYHATLAENAGTVRGLLAQASAVESIVTCLEGLAASGGSREPVWFIGDGNHSLEVARRHWCRLRTELDERGRTAHPARLLLAELVPLQSPGLSILPVHRRIHGIAEDVLRGEFEKFGLVSKPCALLGLREDLLADPGRWIAGWTSGGKAWGLACASPRTERFDKILDTIIPCLQAQVPTSRIDYLHGWDEADPRSNGGCTVLVRAETRHSLARAFKSGKIFPPKSFSLGSPLEKRHYLEARALRPPPLHPSIARMHDRSSDMNTLGHSNQGEERGC